MASDADKDTVIVWCGRCSVYFRVTRERYSGTCTRCGGMVGTMRCVRCGYEWTPKNAMKLPGTCPGCCSPYWDRERKRPVADNRQARPHASRAGDDGLVVRDEGGDAL